ncbi:MAG: ADP-ribosylation factor-like protein [Candidatus Odinarchaeota archaeon]
MSHPDTPVTDKVLLMGLAESGKTTIIKVVTEGYAPDKKAPYTATLNYERKNATILGNPLTIFDLGGQVAFLDRFTGELAEFIFSEVQALIFVVDTVNVAELSRAKYYFDMALKQLDRFSPAAAVHVLLHKKDLINPEKIQEIEENMKSYLRTDRKREVAIYMTSVFDESIFTAFGQILGTTVTDEVAREKIESFIQENSETVEAIQLFAENGAPLTGTSDFYRVPLDQFTQTVNKTLQMVTSAKESTIATLLESKRNVFMVRFLANGMILLASFSKKKLTENNENIPAAFQKVTALAKSLY